MERIKRILTSAAIASGLMALAACAGTTRPTAPSQGAGNATSQSAVKRIPKVQDCGVLNTGSPSRFVCDGKVYTSFQLAKLREDQAAKYASGK